jgi:hypothetical protein
MASGWLAVLQMVPWSDVIKTAPKVADGAKKLWDTVSRKRDVPSSAWEADGLTRPTPSQLMEMLQSRVDGLEAANQELHDQMLASSGLIRTLAEQNAQLIQGVEVQRVRWLVLAGFATLTFIIATTGLVLHLAGR